MEQSKESVGWFPNKGTLCCLLIGETTGVIDLTPTMGTIALKQPWRVWTPNGFHSGTFPESNGDGQSPQVYDS